MYPHPSHTDDEPTMTDLRGVLPSQRPPVDRTVLEEPTSEVPVIKPRTDFSADADPETEEEQAQLETEPAEEAVERADEPAAPEEELAEADDDEPDETAPLPLAPPPVVASFGAAPAAPVVDVPAPSNGPTSNEMGKMAWSPTPPDSPLTAPEPERYASPEPNGWAPVTEPADRAAGWYEPAEPAAEPEPAGFEAASEPAHVETADGEATEVGEFEPVTAETSVVEGTELESEVEAEPEPVVHAEPVAEAAEAGPARVAEAEPAPEPIAEPEPALVSEPEPGVVSEPEPGVVSEPEPGVVSEPAAAAVDEPAPALAAVTAPARRPGEVPEVPIALWPDEDADRLRAELRELQGTFFDDPAAAVAGAKRLVTDAVHALADTLLAAQDQLDPYRDTDQVDTEAMRVAMRRYREFLERVLAL